VDEEPIFRSILDRLGKRESQVNMEGACTYLYDMTQWRPVAPPKGGQIGGSLLLGDPRQRPMHRAPSTAGGCNAEASRRYLLEGRTLDPKRRRLLLVLPGLELCGPG